MGAFDDLPDVKTAGPFDDLPDVETKTPGFLGPAFPLQEGEPPSAPISQEVMQDVPWMTRFRMSPVGRTLLGPTEEEKAGMAGGVSGARIKPQEIAEQALEATTPAKALPFLSQIAPYVPLSPISPLLGGLPKAFESGIKQAAINFPLAPLPGPKIAAGRAALVAFGTQFLASQPETLKAFKDAIKRKDYDEATKIAATELAMAAGLGLGGKEALAKTKPPALPTQQAIAAAEPLLPQAAQAAKETKGPEYASEISKAAEVHGDVQPFAGKGVREVPVEESGAGVQPQTEGGIPEAQAPSPAPESARLLLTPEERAAEQRALDEALGQEPGAQLPVDKGTEVAEPSGMTPLATQTLPNGATYRFYILPSGDGYAVFMESGGTKQLQAYTGKMSLADAQQALAEAVVPREGKGKIDIQDPEIRALSDKILGVTKKPKSVTEIPLPYGVTPEELEAAGGDMGRAIDSAWERTKQMGKAEEQRIQETAAYQWNTKNKRWGQVWSEVKQNDLTGRYEVAASLEGSMSGLPIADFKTEDAARAFAKDFRQGKVFAVKNGKLWEKLVDSADKAKRFPAHDWSALRAYGRTEGISPHGFKMDTAALWNLYESGKTIDDVMKSTPPPKETPTAPSAVEPSSQTPATQGSISKATTEIQKPQEPFLGKTKAEWTPEYYKSLSPENRRAARAQVISALKSEGGTTKVTQESKPPVVIKGIHELLDLREKKKATAPKFTLSEDKTNVTFTDPKTGNTIVARIERVPGEKGEGAFVPTIDISTPTRVGGSSNPGNFTQSFEQAQAQLKQMLENKGFSGLQASKITEASLAYGGSWKEGVLEKQKGYDPEVAAEQERFIGKIQQIGEKAKEEFAKQRQPQAFGAGPPEAGQWLTDQDIAKIPKLVKDYGDFWVVLKWAASPREAIRASDLAKHYDRIIKGKEAANQYEYLREVFVRQDPFKDVQKPPPTEPPPTLQLRVLPPLGIVEFVKQDVIPFVKKGVDTAKATAKLFVDTFSPASHAETPDVNILFEGKGFKEKVETRIVSAFENMKKRFDAMPQADQIAFVDRVKRGQAQPTPELQATANLIRKWDDVLYSLITRYKPTVPYLDNHMRVLWQKVPGQPTAIGTQKAGIRGKRPFQGSKGFLKKHVLADMSEGIRLGGVPVTYNPVELFTLHAQDVMKFVAANRAWEGLKRIGSVEFVRRGHKAPVGFVRFDDPIAKTYFRVPQGLVVPGEYYVQEGTARMLHNYLSRDWVRTGPAGPIGRALLGLKNFTTNIELGMSPFHAFFESNEAIGSSFGLGLRKISSGQYAAGLKDIAQALPSSIPIVGPLIPKTAPWETAKLGGRFIKYAKNPAEFAAQDPAGFAWLRQHYPETQKLVNDLFTAGGQVGMHQEYRYALRRGFAQAVKTENYVGAVVRALPALNQVMQKPLFETYIPRLKVGMWLREYSQALRDRAGDLASGRTTRPQLARETWSFIEDRFGELNWDNLYWNRTMKSAMQLMFRSVTWKLGNLRGFGKAGRDVAGEVVWRALVQGKGPRMTYPMMWLAGMSLVTAIQSSIISKVSTGKYPWELVDEGLGYLKSGVDLLKNLTFPRIDSKDPTQRVSIPTYWRDAVHIARSAKGLGWDYIRSSMTGEINRFAESLNNKDFYGHPIYNPLDPIQKRAYDFMAHLVPTPFGISSYQRATETGATTPQALAGVAGYTKAPSAIEPAPTSQVYDLAESWMAKQGGKTQETARRRAVQEQRHAEEPSIYQPLKIALKANRMDDAGKEYDKLLALRRSTESVSDRHKQILLALRPFTMGKKEPGTDYQPKHMKPFTGNLADEKKFLKSLTPEQRKIYDAAIASKQEIYQRFLELMKTR